jgi:hypothetical protein
MAWQKVIAKDPGAIDQLGSYPRQLERYWMGNLVVKKLKEESIA